MNNIEMLLILSVLIYIVNVIPVFMPPTWTILAFCYITFHIPLLPAVFLGALFATLGRVTLYFFSKTALRKIFSKKYINNYDALGKFFDKKQKLSIPLFLTYAFFPISSNYVYIAAGLAKINIKILASCFFAGRLISYFFWAATSHIVVTKLEDVFSHQLTNTTFIILEVLGLLVIILIGKINWAKFLHIDLPKT